jgi:cyclopropane-fatty-acyl-phospholipid synthase
MTDSRDITAQLPAYLLDASSDRRAGPISALARLKVLSVLGGIKYGYVSVFEKQNRFDFGDPSSSPEMHVQLRVLDPRFYTSLAFKGSIGAGEAYIQGYWTCDRLATLVRLMVRNQDLLEVVDGGLGRLFSPLHRIFHKLRRNTSRGSKKNISNHYDLGNKFFSLFLDQNMMYSCAYFKDRSQSLEEAAAAKIRRVCEKLKLKPSDHLIEIGTGWGGFALYAAKNYGCRVTTTTISEEQYELASRRIKDAGLSDKVTLLCQDYRNLTGQFDKLVSIEMVEAVGHEFLDTYFCKCDELLKPGGLGLIQAIIIADRHYDRSLHSVDFIQRYIFPGSALPSVAALKSSLSRVSGALLLEIEDITYHYAETLRRWRGRFLSNLSSVRRQGFSKRFIRMWDFYFCYCEGGFEERHIGDVQLLFKKDLAGEKEVVNV